MRIGVNQNSVMEQAVDSRPPATIEACRTLGRRFGLSWAEQPRPDFEEALSARLLERHDALDTAEIDIDEALAAFDQAAWEIWDVAQAGGILARLQQRSGRAGSGHVAGTDRRS